MNHVETIDARSRAHARAAAAVTIVASVAGPFLASISLEAQILVAGLAIVLLGFPHGALDPLIIQASRGSSGTRTLLGFLFAYLVLAFAIVGLWVVSTALGLALFLLSSVLHFGEGDAPRSIPRRRRWICVLSHGSAPILLPAAFYPADVGEVFGWLLNQDGAGVAGWLFGWRDALVLAWVAMAGLGHLGRWDAAERRSVVELTLLLIAFVALPPLLSFSVYFCAWHSARHLLSADVVMGGELRHRAAVVGLTVLVATAVLMGGGHLAAG
ncbi:MAG: Brp/Blh family beta-carotene 15,15'-dioxygenase, partial [Planctomycetota bacterium]